MRATMRYGLAGNMEDAHYVMYAADAARRAGLSHTRPGDHGSEGLRANGEGASASNGRGRGSGGKPQPVGWRALLCFEDRVDISLRCVLEVRYRIGIDGGLLLVD